jgi:predicted secreted hydrolase
MFTAPLVRAEARKVDYPAVVPGRRLEFPRDHGAHPAYRIEWWYVTGWLARASRAPLGFQITFFRARAEYETDNPSPFALRQALFAHAALADPEERRLAHDQRAARVALGLAGAAEGRTRAWIDDWRFEQTGSGYRSDIAARGFALKLGFEAVGAPLLQGDAGYSRKGPRPQEASYYYTRPQLRVSGTIERAGRSLEVEGTAWLDHEWSSAYLAPEAAGWDWIGINLAGGGALMAFRMRAKAGGVYYAGGTLRGRDGSVRRFAANEVAFEPLRRWKSPRTGVEYPVAMRVRAGDAEWSIEPLMDDQELDSRASIGTIYWEGAARALANGSEVGRGYLELTGYWRPMRM